jgi:uncharacterized membrane protein YkvA (DUF1232 family)
MSMIWQRLRAWAKGMNADILALWIAARDSRTPAVAKLIAAIVAAYALSPIDLIPDFIPVIGYLDDLLIVPLGIVLAVRLSPPPLMEEYRAEAQRRSARPSSRAGAAFVVLLWLAAAAAMWLWFEPKT